MELSTSEHIVKTELERLLRKHSLEEAICAVDEIVLNYVLGILESVGSHGDMEDTEDVEQFAEMMEAYLPGFAAISISEVCDWMFGIADRLSELHSTGTSSIMQPLCAPLGSTDKQCVQTEKPSKDSSESVINGTKLSSGHLKRQHSTSDKHCLASCDASSGEDSHDAETDSAALDALREVCPAAISAELQHCWQLSGGDVEEAARLLLYRQETGTAITTKATPSHRKKSSKSGVGQFDNDDSMKDTILAKYSFVDADEDKKTYNPSLSLKEEKKLVRYRDGQVVSTKGERFSEIKRQETEEMKKTYVNLKPARKYRFH